MSNNDVLLHWPMAQHIITAGWLYNDGSLHRALDFRAAVGTPVYAAEDGTLYKCVQAHTSQADWTPGEAGTESLWTEICQAHDGTKYDPVPYSGNMALENGKYYTQDGVLYLCNRDTGNPVYHPLSALVGLYVTVVEVN